jgi:hypothetical protein
MLELLREHEVGPRFRKIKKDASEVVVAVPFWGKGAIKMLGLDNGKKARIICNLSSMACNPYVIEALMKQKAVNVRSHPRLHAKIYVGPNFGIVGSSNASTNGLTEEGDAAKGWIEANILSNDPHLVAKALNLFEGLWTSEEAGPIRAAALKRAKTAYDNRPPNSVPTNAATLLAACDENPSLFQSVFVAAHDENIGPNAKRMMASLKNDSAAPKANLTAADFKSAWGYQFGQDTPEGSWLIDLSCRTKRTRITGCARVTGLVLKVKDEFDLMLAVPGVVRSPVDGRRLPISAKEKQVLVEHASLILKRTNASFVSLPKVLQWIKQK